MSTEEGDDRSSISQSEDVSTRNTRSRSRSRSLASRRSRRSLGRTLTQSGPPSPDTQMHRIYSAGFQDDHGTYFHPEDIDRIREEAPAPDVDTELTPEASSEKHDEKEAEEDREDREEVESQDFESGHERTAGDRSGENSILEKAHPMKRQKSSKSTQSQRQRDPNMVSWQGADDPENPKNWPTRKKWAAVVVVSSFTFISPVASSMVAPALPQMATDLNVHNTVLSQMMLSIFILAYAIGPMFLGPLSEIYGRVPVLQIANLFFLIFNLVCGFAKNGTQMLVFRFFAGLGGSAPLAIGGGILADCFTPEQRGKAIAVYSAAPLVGPAVGPIAGGFIAENTTWRWAFWAVSMACVAIQISGLFFLQETWAPKLLEQKVKKLKKETGNEKLYAEVLKKETFIHKMEHSLVRPFRLLFTQPIVIALAVYMAYLYGLVYLVLSSFAALFASRKYYNETVGISGLNYIALAIGYFFGMQITSRFNDWVYRKLKKRNGGVGQPEFRMPVMIPCAVLLPVGLFWYGWSAEARIHWIMPDIGAAITAAATICGYQSIQTYVIDSYSTYAASAVAAISFLRSLAGFGFPLFAPTLYDNLGYGWGNSVLAFVALAIGIPAPWLFWHYGARLRAKSRYAAG